MIIPPTISLRYKMSKIVAQKLAFVTGAGSGIGREVCKILAREGARVIATDQHVDNARETLKMLEGSNHMALGVEITDADNIRAALKTVSSHYSSSPSIIVNSAGITRDNFILKLHENEFDKVIEVNLKGTFLIMRTVVQTMIEANETQGSSIINISSIIGKVGNVGQSNYSASKAGVIALTKTASQEFGSLGIRVNAVLPGFIETPMTETVPDNVKQIFLKRIPLRRMGKPEEVAEAIVFLASDRSSYINGTCIEVTGGMC